MYKKININSNNVRGFKVKLYPTDEQKSILQIHMSLFRFVYNWALNESNNYFNENKVYIGKTELMKRFAELRNQTEWLQDIPLHSARLAIAHLDFGYKKFFKHDARHPRFKSKKNIVQKVHYRNESYAFNLDDNSVRIPGFKRGERILCKNHNIPPSSSGYYNCTITFDGINYWLSVNTEIDLSNKLIQSSEYQEAIGIDVGIKKFAQLSDGTVYQPPKILKTIDKRVRKQQSRLSKMKNRRIIKARQEKTNLDEIPLTKNEAKLQEDNINLRIRRKNIMKSFLHQSTSEIANKYPSRIVMENLDISSFINRKSKKNNKSDIYHANWYKFREILKYKSEERGIDFILADRCFPSSQICSNCGNIRKTSNREYICHECGFRIDRDLNAAINLSRIAY